MDILVLINDYILETLLLLTSVHYLTLRKSRLAHLPRSATSVPPHRKNGGRQSIRVGQFTSSKCSHQDRARVGGWWALRGGGCCGQTGPRRLPHGPGLQCAAARLVAGSPPGRVHHQLLVADGAGVRCPQQQTGPDAAQDVHPRPDRGAQTAGKCPHNVHCPLRRVRLLDASTVA